jgi:hypothetical protein
MASMPFALSVHNLVSSVGADAGFAAVVGLAILALLYFAHARDTANLREEAAVLAQRLQEAEAQLAAARRVQPVAVAPAPAAAQPPPLSEEIPFAPAGVAAPALTAATRVIPLPARAAAVSPVAAASAAVSPAAAASAAAAAAAAIKISRVAPAPAVPGAAAAAASTETAAPEVPAAAPVSTPPPAPTPEPASVPAVPSAPVPAPIPAAVAAFRTAPATVAGAASSGTATAGTNGSSADAGGDADAAPPVGEGPVAAPPLPEPPVRATVPPPRPPESDLFMSSRSAPPSRVWRRLAVLVGLVLAIGAVVAVIIATSGTGTQNPGSGQAGSGRVVPVKPAFDPAHVTVAVLNGTNTNQLAHHVADRLAAEGFKKGTVATASNQTLMSTVVAYRPGAGNRNDALHVARTLKLSPKAVAPIDQAAQAVACPPPGACTANVVVSVGADLAGAY